MFRTPGSRAKSKIVRTPQLTVPQQPLLRADIYAAPFDSLAYQNIVFNQNMDNDQEFVGTSNASTNGAYCIDGWIIGKAGTMVCNMQQVADAPPGYTYSLKMTVGTAEAVLAAGDLFYIYQAIESLRTARLSFGTVNAQPITLGFWTKMNRPGVYSGALRNTAVNRSYVFQYVQNAANTWQYNTVTIPGDVAGTWNGGTASATAMYLSFAVAAGSSSVANPGAWGSNGSIIAVTSQTNGVAATTDTFQLTGVTMFPGTIGPSSARAPFIVRQYEDELRLCQRYYWSGRGLSAYGSESGVAGAGHNISGYFPHPGGRMRAAPASAIVGVWTVSSVNQPTVLFTNEFYLVLTAISTALNGQAIFQSVPGSAYTTSNARLT